MAMRALTLLASRFVAGETSERAISAGLKLRAQGLRATFDLLGEDVKDAASARRIAAANRALLRQIPSQLEPNVSVKLTNLGLDVSRSLCLELCSGILETAAQAGGFVRIDMEGSAHTQATLDVFHALRETHENVGIALQAYLLRTRDDVREAIARGDRVRLCKGAYKEPSSIALTDIDFIRKSFSECAQLLLQDGNHPALATHDESLLRGTLAYAREHGIGPERFELQMLYGLRRRRARTLARDGYQVRVYVPYGTHWMPYFYRRLRERRQNVAFVVRHLVHG
jgi:proline dehydrogenase